MPKIAFEFNSEKVIRGWRKWCNEELHDLCSTFIISWHIDDDDNDDGNNNDNNNIWFLWRNNITHTTNCNHRTATTLYNLQTYFVSGV
jgi:hypothetical protein